MMNSFAPLVNKFLNGPGFIIALQQFDLAFTNLEKSGNYLFVLTSSVL
jgi:hypothetical protein